MNPSRILPVHEVPLKPVNPKANIHSLQCSPQNISILLISGCVLNLLKMGTGSKNLLLMVVNFILNQKSHHPQHANGKELNVKADASPGFKVVR